MKTISWDDFMAVDIRVGTVLSVESLRGAKKPAYVLTIDFGNQIGILKSSSQITTYYKPERLIDRQILGVINFPPKQIGTVISQCLVLGLYDDSQAVVLAGVDRLLPNGSRLC